MKTIKISKNMTTIFSFNLIVSIFIACNNERGIMQGNSSMGLDNWNWLQILVSIGIGLLIGLIIGFLFGSQVCKRKM